MPAKEHLQRECLFPFVTENLGAVFPSAELQGSKGIPHFHPGFTVTPSKRGKEKKYSVCHSKQGSVGYLRQHRNEPELMSQCFMSWIIAEKLVKPTAAVSKLTSL